MTIGVQDRLDKPVFFFFFDALRINAMLKMEIWKGRRLGKQVGPEKNETNIKEAYTSYTTGKNSK